MGPAEVEAELNGQSEADAGLKAGDVSCSHHLKGRADRRLGLQPQPEGPLFEESTPGPIRQANALGWGGPFAGLLDNKKETRPRATLCRIIPPLHTIAHQERARAGWRPCFVSHGCAC